MQLCSVRAVAEYLRTQCVMYEARQPLTVSWLAENLQKKHVSHLLTVFH